MIHARQLTFGLLCLIWLTPAPAQKATTAGPVLMHLPGIGGHMRVDDLLIDGLRQGRIDGHFQIYDWTNGNPGIPALAGYERNRQEAKKVAEQMIRVLREDPNRRFILTCHSGGAGLAVWALEELPDDLKIDTLVMIAPALSPGYDLSRALSRVRGRAYSFNSTLDPILGFGTRNLGTIDRVNSESAGNVGFQPPASADMEQYGKLVQIPYNADWTRLGNAGDHIGAMNRLFARTIIAPLLLSGSLPRLPSTQPSTQPAASPMGR